MIKAKVEMMGVTDFGRQCQVFSDKSVNAE